ncbi:16S rRNA (cytosine(967)-C(5))-methyltransferase RsmB [Clostridium sp. MT-14]|uniref:16S rRNA (cytosine(967)-C(5))-methyltransferase n=1 Tax=Clostridium aromativorans TaxID=2836848 RepID=A0ABS8N4F4_9CLOT|nr:MULTISPECIES: 16S rRNA (cytosine(967)-C(5))-methyltransferase RsmB [Clostridium]KAA8677045.1 16S rRNA (cytosine(967)-C(5))-methyltransferase RsmB [Clostridium sp. HV4-5-A1G]MCC9294672.1 16S rRNA (cytosine(967)-C(5))-methyltransferase RsmB [Clostridium aromativorans]CAB1243601.1 Ribosomal RNA small subunit methyltransferase B [Clostridiaceae bacterium BL-3]
MINPRGTAVKVLKQVLDNNAYSNVVLSMYLNKENLDRKDRALVTELVYGTLRYKYTIDSILDSFIKSDIGKMDGDILNILRMSVYQLRYLSKIPEFAVVNEAVELSKRKSVKLSKLVNGVLRNYLRNKDTLTCEHKGDKMSRWCFKYSFSRWMAELFITQYGEKTGESILKNSNIVPKVTVRVNTLKIKYEQVWNELIKNGYDVKEGTICKEALIIKKGSNIELNPLFKKGYITVQDESSMLVAHVMDLEENMTVLDLCSAPGGKSCHIAELMKNTGKVYACDLHANKMSLVKENASRLGVENLIYNVFDAEKYIGQFENAADRVLIDVPCSGLGIIRKKPEIKWTKNKDSMDNLVKIQRNIMLNASKYVKQEGKLIYSTCTLNKVENNENINWFIQKNPQFKLEKINFGDFENIIYDEKGYITVLPNDNMDGFFIAKMIKYR